MKHSFYAAFALLTIIASPSCKKDEEVQEKSIYYKDVTLTVSTEPESIVDSDGKAIHEINWKFGDSVKGFFGTGYSAEYVASDINGRASTFNTTASGTYTTSSTMLYFNKVMYPFQSDASATLEEIKLTFSSSTEAEKDIADLIHVMIGRANKPTLQIYNVCSYLKFSVSTPGISYLTIQSIDDSVKLSGEVTFGFENEIPYVYQSKDGNSTLDILAPDNGTFEPGVTYYARLLPSDLSGSGYKIYYRAPKGYYCIENKTAGLKFTRNHVTEIKDKETDGTFIPCSGFFLCDKEKTRIHFASGNLQYLKNNSSWKFATNQYDISSDENIIDKFGWSTTDEGNNWGMGKVFTGGFADWGKNSIKSSDGSMTFEPSFWKTPTCDELRFILMKRSGPHVGKTTDARFFKACVNGIPGIILVPNLMRWPDKLETPKKINEVESSFTENIYNLDQFAQLESRGVVFLPASYFDTKLSDIKGFYWESTSTKDEHACAFNTDYNSVAVSNSFRREKLYNVRLVFSFNPKTEE